jgi:CheY-like chemotaxis protein
MNLPTAYPCSRREVLADGSQIVLLVESHDDSRDMYAQYLRACGFTVRTAGSTDEGLMLAGDADVIVTEIRVQGSFDGIEFVGRLRDDDGTKQTPIIVLTACAFEPDQRRARAAGCTVFLPKPCLPEQLAREIRDVGATTGT